MEERKDSIATREVIIEKVYTFMSAESGETITMSYGLIREIFDVPMAETIRVLGKKYIRI